MSILKKGVKAIKKVAKKAVGFVKKYWKQIALVALIVFTAGVATLGAGAFSAAWTGAAGFSAKMGVVGSTMWTGVTAAAGSLGIGGGASGTVAAQAGVTGYGLGAGMGLGNSFGLGVAGANASAAATAAATATPLAGISPLASSVGLPANGVGIAVNPATGLSVAPTTAKTFAAANTMAPSAAVPAKAGFFSSDLAKSALITTGGNMISGYAAGKAAEGEDPKGFWGVDLSGKGQDVAFNSGLMNQQPAFSAPQAPQDFAPQAPMSPQQQMEMFRYQQQYGLMNPQNGYAAPGVPA